MPYHPTTTDRDREAHTRRNIQQVREIEPKIPEAASRGVNGTGSVEPVLLFRSMISIFQVVANEVKASI